MSTAAAEHCFALVREADKDRWLAGLFAPEAKRPALYALYGFNLEIARIRETVSEPRLGEIRHQWWRDALDGIYAGAAPAHPVVQELARAIAVGDLPKAALMGMIEARRFDLYDDPMPTLNDLEGYLGETSSVLIQLAARLLAGQDARGAADSAGLAGVAYGLVGLLRALPVHRKRGQCYVPLDLMRARNIEPARLIGDAPNGAVDALLTDLRGHAAKRLGEARAKASLVPPAALPAFLPMCLTDLYLEKLARLGANALSTEARVAQWRRQWRLYLRARDNRF